MNNEELIGRLRKLNEYASILQTPDEFFRHMQGHYTELSFVLVAFDLAGEVKQVISALEKQILKQPEISSLVEDRKNTFCPDYRRSSDWEPSEEFKQLLDTL